MTTSTPDQPSFNNPFLILTYNYYTEKDLLLIMVNHEIAFKFKVNENENILIQCSVYEDHGNQC